MLGGQISQLKSIQIIKKFNLFMIKTLHTTIIPTKFHINVKLGIVCFFSFNSDTLQRYLGGENGGGGLSGPTFPQESDQLGWLLRRSIILVILRVRGRRRQCEKPVSCSSCCMSCRRSSRVSKKGQREGVRKEKQSHWRSQSRWDRQKKGGSWFLWVSMREKGEFVRDILLAIINGWYLGSMCTSPYF